MKNDVCRTGSALHVDAAILPFSVYSISRHLHITTVGFVWSEYTRSPAAAALIISVRTSQPKAHSGVVRRERRPERQYESYAPAKKSIISYAGI